MKTEVLVECPVCRRDKWVDWNRKRDSFCYECPDLADSPPVMIPQTIPQSCDAVADWFVTREAK